jgi:hypothetical protein
MTHEDLLGVWQRQAIRTANHAALVYARQSGKRTTRPTSEGEGQRAAASQKMLALGSAADDGPWSNDPFDTV